MSRRSASPRRRSASRSRSPSTSRRSPSASRRSRSPSASRRERSRSRSASVKRRSRSSSRSRERDRATSGGRQQGGRSRSRERNDTRRERSRSRERGGGGGGGGRYGGNRERGGGGARPQPQSLLVRNLGPDTTPDSLRRAFSRQSGDILDVYLPKDYSTNQPRGFAFIEFADSRDAREIKYQMDRSTFEGREIAVLFAQQRRKTPEEMRETPASIAALTASSGHWRFGPVKFKVTSCYHSLRSDKSSDASAQDDHQEKIKMKEEEAAF